MPSRAQNHRRVTLHSFHPSFPCRRASIDSHWERTRDVVENKRTLTPSTHLYMLWKVLLALIQRLPTLCLYYYIPGEGSLKLLLSLSLVLFRFFFYLWLCVYRGNFKSPTALSIPMSPTFFPSNLHSGFPSLCYFCVALFRWPCFTKLNQTRFFVVFLICFLGIGANSWNSMRASQVVKMESEIE